jgi:hypothetical protein
LTYAEQAMNPHFALVWSAGTLSYAIGWLTLMHYESVRNAIEALKQRDSAFELSGAPGVLIPRKESNAMKRISTTAAVLALARNGVALDRGGDAQGAQAACSPAHRTQDALREILKQQTTLLRKPRPHKLTTRNGRFAIFNKIWDIPGCLS